MNLSAGALFIGLITGLLGAWLFLWMSERQHTDYRVQESRVACQQARFDSEFSGNFGKENEAALAREKIACGDFANQVGERVKSEEKAKREAEQLKKSIEKALTTEEAQAQEAERQARETASAVKATATAAVKDLKK